MTTARALAGYADQCRLLADECIESLTESDVDLLRQRILAMGACGWLDWRESHKDRVAAFVAATPSARGKQRRFSTDHHLLALAAYAHCHEGADLLMAACRIAPGSSYRRMAAEAGEEAAQLRWLRRWDEWPFDEPDPLDPLSPAPPCAQRPNPPDDESAPACAKQARRA